MPHWKNEKNSYDKNYIEGWWSSPWKLHSGVLFTWPIFHIKRLENGQIGKKEERVVDVRRVNFVVSRQLSTVTLFPHPPPPPKSLPFWHNRGFCNNVYVKKKTFTIWEWYILFQANLNKYSKTFFKLKF